jgi:hypothetical protein
VRVEWSGGWAYTAAGAWTNAEVIDGRIPASITQGVAEDAGFRAAVDMLDRLDPHRVFSTKCFDRLMPRSADLSGDGVVDGADLGATLARWGRGNGSSMMKPHDLGPTEELAGAVEFVSGGCHRNRNCARLTRKQMTQRGSGIHLRVDVSTNHVGKIDIELN